jgi:hypothetical protein
MKRLAYLRAEASEAVDSFEESVNEIETRIDNKENSSVVDTKEGVEGSKIPVNESSVHMTKFTGKKEETSSGAAAHVGGIIEEPAITPADDDLKNHYKRLWRVVAKLTHPDAVGNNDELISLYKAAASAYERDRREELLDVASEVNAQLEKPHPKMFEDLDKRCVHYESMIRKIRGSVAWQWKNAQEGTKQEIIDLIKSKREEKAKQSPD